MRTLILALLVPALVLAQAPASAPDSEDEAPRTPRRGMPRRIAPSAQNAPAAQAQPAPGAQPAPQPPGTPRAPPPPPPPGQPAPSRPAPTPPPPPAGKTGTAETLRPESKCVPLSGRFMLSFNKADIVDVLEQASRWTCRNFLYTDDIARGKITLISKTPVTADEAYAAFLVALNTNNIAVYQTGRYYKLIRTADSKKNPIPTYTDADATTPASEQPITKVLRLSFVDADQMRGIVANFVSPQGADVVAIPPDTLIITDIGLNLRRIERIVDSIDRAGSGELVRIVQIRYASAKDVADKLNQIFQAQGRAGTARRTLISGQPAAPSRPGQPPAAAPPPPAAGGRDAVEVSVSRIIADDRTNKIIIIADEKSFQRIVELIDQLDVPTAGEGGINVVFLKNANAEELAQTLSNLAQGQARTRPPGVPGAPIPAAVPPGQVGGTRPPGAAGVADIAAELFAGEVKITADKAQNALLVQASGADFQTVQRLIDKLDRARRQVFVEAVILEVNLRNENQFGVGAHTAIPFDYRGDTGVIPIASQPGRVSSFNLGSVIQLGGFLTGFAGPVSSELSKLGINLPSVGVLVQALQSSSDVNVLSTPHLVATDNEESEITVGSNVPFQAGFAPPGLSNLVSGTTGTGTTPTNATALGNILGLGGLSSLYAPIQRQPVELRLKLKPQINEGGNVRLTLDVQNEEIAERDPQLGPTTSKRTVKTQVVARDQSTIVIGGLIQERSVRSVRKVPFLGSLPLLGWLFRDSVTTKTKTNLLVFLTPYIIRDEADYRRIYEKKRKEQQDFVEQFYGRQPAFEVDIDFSRKAGPYARMREAVIQEAARIENGGPGAAGERIIAPPGGPRVGPPALVPGVPAPEAPDAGEDAAPEEGAPVDRLDVLPQVPTPGGPQPDEAPAPPSPPDGQAPAPEGQAPPPGGQAPRSE